MSGWSFQPWPADEAASDFVASPIAVTFASRARRRTTSILRDPVVVRPFSSFGGPAVHLAPPSLTQIRLRQRQPKSILRKPVVVTAAAAAPLPAPVRVELARERPRRSNSFFLRGPGVIASPAEIRVTGALAPLADRVPPTQAILRRPTVVAAVSVEVYSGPETHLSRSRRGQAKARLSGPEVVFAPPVYGGPFVKLVTPRAKNPTVHSKLPTVIAQPVVAAIYTGPATSFAPQARGKIRSFYIKPTVQFVEYFTGPVVKLVAPRSRNPGVHSKLPQVVPTAVVAEVYSGPETHLTRITRPQVHAILRDPVVVGPVLARPIQVSLTPGRAGAPKSHLSPPAVVAAFRARPTEVSLARIRPVPVTAFLRPPTDLVDRDDLGTLRVALAPSHGPRTMSRLRPPAVVAPVLARPELVSLAPSSRGLPKSVLRDPAVVAPVLAPPISTTFARIKHPPVEWRLGRPTDLVDQQDLGEVKVTLTPGRAGKPKSELRPPAVVAPVLARPVDITLARIKHPPVESRLGKPTDLVDAQDLGEIRTKLARIRPVPTDYVLREPVVIDLRPQVYELAVHLAPSSRGIPKSLLGEPSKFAAQPKAETTLQVALAYSRRGKPKSKLRPPTVVTPATPYLRREPVALVRIRPRRTVALLSPPAVVRGFVATPVAVWLTRNAPRPTLVILRPPTVTFRTPVDLAAETQLVRIRPPAVHSKLRAPVVVLTRDERSIEVTLAPQSRRPGAVLLSPPAVVATPQAVLYPTRVALAYSVRGRTMWILPTVAFEEAPGPCYGQGTGVVSASAGNEFVEVIEAQAIGTTSAGAAAAASAVSATTMGETAPGAENEMEDEQREGC